RPACSGDAGRAAAGVHRGARRAAVPGALSQLPAGGAAPEAAVILDGAPLMALKRAFEHEMLSRLPGGIWTHEPEAWRAGERDAVTDEWWRSEVVNMLAARGLLSARGPSAYVITQAGRTAVLRAGARL